MDGGRHLSKRAKKKLMKSQNESTNLAQSHTNQLKSLKTHHSDEGNVELCVAALNSLISFCDAVNCIIKPAQARTIQQHVVQLCLTLEIETGDKLYYSGKTRQALYRALYSLATNSHHLTPPPMQYILRLLTEAANADRETEIREMCHNLTLSLGKSLRPQRQSLFFEVDEREMEAVVKTFQEEKLESESEEEMEVEVIEEKDESPEPPTKRSKIEEPEVEIEKVEMRQEEPEESEKVEEELAVMEKEEIDRTTEILETPVKIPVNGIIEPVPETESLPVTKEILTDPEIERRVEELIEDFVPE